MRERARAPCYFGRIVSTEGCRRCRSTATSVAGTVASRPCLWCMNTRIGGTMSTYTRNLTLALAALAVAAASGGVLAQGKGKDPKEPPGQSQERKAKQHKHKDGKALLGDKIKQNGRHKIDQNGKYSTCVETHNGKIRGVSVNHADKGNVPVTK